MSSLETDLSSSANSAKSSRALRLKTFLPLSSRRKSAEIDEQPRAVRDDKILAGRLLLG